MFDGREHDNSAAAMDVGSRAAFDMRSVGGLTERPSKWTEDAAATPRHSHIGDGPRGPQHQVI